MVRTNYKSPKVDYKKRVAKSMAIPDQSMSIKELVRRFVKGIPADVIQREAIYNPENNDVDLERLSRLDLTDKAYEVTQMRAQNAATQEQIQRVIDNAQARSEQADRDEDRGSESTQKGSGIGDLDNTMPDDTDLTNSKKGGKKSTTKK